MSKPVQNDNTQDMVNILRRIRILEERYNNLRKKSLVVEQNQILHKKSISNEIKAVELEMISIKKEFITINDKMSLIGKELNSLADESEIRYLTKYLEFFNISDFVSVNELNARLSGANN